MNSLKKKIVLIALICLSVLIGSFGGIVLAKNRAKLFALNGAELTIAKVRLYTPDDPDDSNYYALHYNFETYEGNIFYSGTNYYTYNAEKDTYEIDKDPSSTNGKTYYTRSADIYAEKVDLNDTSNNPFMTIVNKSNAYDGSYIQELTDDDNVFMLKNSELETKELTVYVGDAQNSSTVTYYQKEFMLVQFKSAEDATLISLSTNATLNETKIINTKDKINTDNVVYYSQFFDLTDTEEIDSTSLESTTLDEFNAQGLYSFDFTYNIRVNGVVTTNVQENAEFYVLSEKYYLNNTQTNATTEPRLFNTERIDKKYDTGNTYPIEKHFFDYSNDSTTDYDRNAIVSNGYLKYPTVMFDASKYNLSFTKTMSGLTTSVTTALDTTDQDNPELVLTYQSLTGTQTKRLPVENNIATVVFEDVGNYVLNFDFVIDGTILDSSNSKTLFAKKENWDLLHTDELTIFGYQLMHSEYLNENGATEKEMKDVDLNLYADITNANIGYTSGDFAIYEKIPTTNQAPLLFKYYASLIPGVENSYYYYYTKNNNTYTKVGDKNALTSNTRFTDAGLYYVYLTYTFPGYKFLENNKTEDGPEITKFQIFAFEIENVEPDVKFFTVETSNYEEVKSSLTTGSYTNKTVEIDWQDALKNPFDVKPRITISAQSFEKDAKLTNITSQFASTINSGKIRVSDSSIYTVKVEYGPCTYNHNKGDYEYSASITYSFVIDKEDIDSIKFFTSNSQKLTELTDNLTGKNFALVFGDITTSESGIVGNQTKNSGAKINATYSYLPLNLGSAPSDPLALNDENDENDFWYVSNGTSITAINQNIQYSPLTIKNLNATNSNVLSSDGIYIFRFVDEAGNVAMRYIAKDTSKPVLLQMIEGQYSIVPNSSSNTENMVNKNTTVIVGKYKAIKLASDEIFDAELLGELKNTAKYNIETIEGENYLLVEMNSIFNNLPTFNTIPTSGTTIYYIGENGTYTSPNAQYVTKDGYSYTFVANENNEHLFKVRVYDKLSNRFEGKVEMSFDKSALQAQMTGLPAQNRQIISSASTFESVGDGTSKRLEADTVSNKKIISFSWIAGEGEFEVAEVTCYFYPLTFETGTENAPNTNYPYAVNPSTSFNLMTNTTTEIVSTMQNGISQSVQRTKTGGINLVQDEKYGDFASVQGMYIIERKYTNEESKTYTFYIDRNNLIANEATNIGDEIKVLLGENENLHTFAGQDFLQEFVNDYIFKTNKQPVKVSVPLFKYYSSQLPQAILESSKLGINKLFFEIVCDGETLDNNQIDSLTRSATLTYQYSTNDLDDGTIYYVKIFDGAYSSANDDENYYNSLEFQVAVKMSKPNATFVDNTTSVALTDTANNYISLNNTNVSLTWQKISDDSIYAKIDENNIKITQRFENGGSTVLYQIENGKETVNRVNVAKEDLLTTSGNLMMLNLNNFESVLANVNCRVEIDLQYKTSQPDCYGNYLKTTKIIYYDYEKPSENFDNLFDGDNYLASSNISKEEFENYDSLINFENYAFVVPYDFSFIEPQKDGFWQMGLTGATENPNDIETRWIRQYNKYENELGVNQQSIVPGDDRYDDSSKAPTRYRFNANLQLPNSGGLVYSVMSSFSFDESGYYEVIEQDCAGNYRIYSIYVLPENNEDVEQIIYNTTIKNPQTDESWETENQWSINSTNGQIEIDNQKLEFLSFENLGDWLLIDVLNGSTNAKLTNTLMVSPLNIDGFVDKQSAIQQINNLIVDENKTGKYFVIKIQSARHRNIRIDYHTPGQAYSLDTNIRATSLILTIDPMKYNGVTYLKSLRVEEINSADGSRSEILQDDNGKAIKTGENYYSLQDDVMIYVFTYSSKGRNLWFTWTDNFGIQYTKNEILGVTQTPFDQMLIFNGNSIKNENYSAVNIVDIHNHINISASAFLDGNYAEYYTNSMVFLEYQPLIYNSFTIYEIDEFEELEVFNGYSTTRIQSKNINRIQIASSNYLNENKNAHLLIVFKDTSGNYYQFSICFYNKIANLEFLDASNNEHIFDKDAENYESYIAKTIYLTYQKTDTTSSYPISTNVQIERVYIGNDNVEYVKDYGVIGDEFVFNEYGTYYVTATNQLGTSKTYSFDLIRSDANYYTVKTVQNGKTVILSPSPVKNYDEIEHYVSIYDATVDVNQEKNLYIKSAIQDASGTTIYTIASTENSGISYSKQIAVTKINATSSIVSENGSLLEIKEVEEETVQTNYINQKYHKSNANKVRLTIPKYFESPSNILKVKVVYNGRDLGFVDLNVDENNDNLVYVDFSTAGRYLIYIQDIAGNRQSFLGTSYFELLLINNFTYNLNGSTGIFNSIFNSSVTLTVLDRTNFVIDNDGKYFSIDAKLNGENYNYTTSGGAYIFNSYGTYTVTLEGYINKDIEGNPYNKVVTIIKFTILNPNEAKTMHEYIGLNGYEITKIEKNGVDVTEAIANKLNVSTINNLAISGIKDGIGGSGNYTITVTALVDKIVGEKSFTYSVWINNDNDILIVPSIAEGESTTKVISIKMNLAQIYSKIGECVIRVNGQEIVEINESSANEVSTFELTENKRFNVTLETQNGNVISSFVVIKIEPLNTVAIVVIVVVSLVVTGLTVTFIILRKRMRIK